MPDHDRSRKAPVYVRAADRMSEVQLVLPGRSQGSAVQLQLQPGLGRAFLHQLHLPGSEGRQPARPGLYVTLIGDRCLSGSDDKTFDSPRHRERFFKIHVGILRFYVFRDQRFDQDVRNGNTVDLHFQSSNRPLLADAASFPFQEEGVSPRDECIYKGIAGALGWKVNFVSAATAPSVSCTSMDSTRAGMSFRRS